MISRKNKKVSINIVIPVYNESDIIEKVFEELIDTFTKEILVKNNIESLKYIIVDDGSDDQSVEKIIKIKEKNIPIKLITLSRNFGHQNAVFAGLENSSADLTAVIDADLQDPPNEILLMLKKWREGYEIVYGVRKNRKENIFKKMSFSLFYRFIFLISDVTIPRDSGDFSLMDKKVINCITKLEEKIKYPRFMRAWVGFKKIPHEYNRRVRVGGESKYGLIKYLRLAIDGITSASTRPLLITQYFLLLFILASAFFGIFVMNKFFEYAETPKALRNFSDEMALWFLITYLFMFFIALIHSISIFVISIYLSKAYIEIKNRPSYIIDRIYDHNKSNK